MQNKWLGKMGKQNAHAKFPEPDPCYNDDHREQEGKYRNSLLNNNFLASLDVMEDINIQLTGRE